MNEIKLHDIKALENIPDYSFYIFLFLIFLALLIIGSIVYFLIKKFFFKKKSLKELAYERLKKSKLNDSKKCAYELTKYGRYFCEDKRVKKLYKELVENLETYKYKKEVDSFDKTTIEQIKRFMDAIDV